MTVTHEASVTEAVIIAVVEKVGYRASTKPFTEARDLTEEVPPGLDVKIIGRPGEAVDLKKHLVPGKLTVFDFYADWCAPCKTLAKKLNELVKELPGLAVRKIDIVNWDSPAGKKFLTNVSDLPHVRVFSAKGRHLVSLSAKDIDRLEKYIRSYVPRQ